MSKRNSLSILCLFLVCFATGCDIVKKPPVEKIGVTQVEVAVFEGGFGIDWHKDMARKYDELKRKEGKNIEINVWGDPRVADKIKPRILRKNPPDAANCSIPLWKLIIAGKLHPYDEILDSPAYGETTKTWRQSFLPGVLEAYKYKGKAYGIPLQFSCWVIWYDARMFREHGWNPPKTWKEL